MGGLYLKGTAFNHDEEPNCAHSFVGRRLLVRTITAVSAGDELTIAYAELAELSSARRARLRAQYFFDPLPKGLLPDGVARRDKLLAEVLERKPDGAWCPVANGLPWSSEAGVLTSATTVPHYILTLAEEVHSAWVAAKAATQAGDEVRATRHLQAAWNAASQGSIRLGDGHALRLAV